VNYKEVSRRREIEYFPSGSLAGLSSAPVPRPDQTLGRPNPNPNPFLLKGTG